MHFLITAGGTREYIDPVRFISNASSGKMGYALAQAAVKAGHKVTLITTVGDLKFKIENSKLKIVKVKTAAQMFKAVQKYFPVCDCLIMAAAVADYTPVKKSKIKIKRAKRNLIIELKPTADILAWASKHKHQRQATSLPAVASRAKEGDQPRFVVGFALEDKVIRTHAEKKLKDKNLDIIIANTPASIGADKATVHIKTVEGKWLKLPHADKTKIAKKIISLASQERPLRQRHE